MIFIIAFSTLLALGYAVLIFRLSAAVKKLYEHGPATEKKPVGVSILVPFRNEQESIPRLLQCLASLDYPSDKLQIIFVDDHSDDHSHALIADFIRTSSLDIKLLSLSDKSGKKAALERGISSSDHEVIAQVDADVWFTEEWLRSITGYFDEDTLMIVGAVRMVPAEGFWSRFAALEYLSLQSVTAAFIALDKPIIASGANLLYTRDLWHEAAIHPRRRSGDDTFLVQYAAKHGRVKFASDRNALVNTHAPDTLRGFLNQRARWGGKSFSYPSVSARLLAIFLAIYNMMILLLMALSFSDQFLALTALVVFVVKALVDYPFLRLYANQTGQRGLLTHYPLSAVIYPFYILVTGILILFGKTEWKGRSFNPATG